MALHRAFSVGRFKCSGASSMIKAADFADEGYVFVIRKDSTRKFCLRCIKDFFSNKAFRATENDNYMTIHYP
jgi:hypothetical protein